MYKGLKPGHDHMLVFKCPNKGILECMDKIID